MVDIKKRRAKKMPVSYTDRVIQAIEANSDFSRSELARATKLTVSQINGIISRIRKIGHFPPGHKYSIARVQNNSTEFTTEEILIVKRIGIEKVKQIIKLLGQL